MALKHFFGSPQAVITTCLLTITFAMQVEERGFLNFLFGPCKCKCGVPNREGRLKGGEFLRAHEFPWMASLQIINNSSAISGSLINNRYVLTAASNLIGITPYDLKVTLGQLDRCFPDVSSTNLSVDKILIHPDFNAANRAHDLALVKLNTPVNFERRVSPICLSFPSTSYLGQVATLVGYNPSSNSSCRPKKLGLPILGVEECLTSALEPQFALNDKACLGIVGATNVVCPEDAGGPVMFRSHSGVYELIGVLTDKNDCTTRGSTALYTTLNPHLSWITDNTKDACYCFKT